MYPHRPLDVLIIGSGRAAFHLGHALVRSGVRIVGVVGRDPVRVDELALALGTQALSLADALPPTAVTLLAVSDDAIAPVAAALPERDGVLVHCSGTRSLDDLLPHGHRAVLWPIQALSAGEPLDLADVPLVVDGNTTTALDAVIELAQRIGPKVHVLAHEQRRRVHLAAAVTSNLPVFLAAEAQRLLAHDGLPTDLLTPLWRTTAERAAALGPQNALTGPARRGDTGTIHAHLDLLTHDPDLRRAYAQLSDMILRAYGHPGLEDPHP